MIKHIQHHGCKALQIDKNTKQKVKKLLAKKYISFYKTSLPKINYYFYLRNKIV